MRLRIDPLEAALRAPFVSASGAVELRPLLKVQLIDADGLVGYGEAAPLEQYDGVSVEGCKAALEDCRDALAAAGEADPHAEVLAECARLAVLPQATAAIDMALLDLAGRRADQPVWRLLGATPGTGIEVNTTIASPDRAGAAAEAARARIAGFRCIKVKVGIGDDLGRLAAVRAVAGPSMAIRIDANGAWSGDQAVASLRALEPVGIELCEEPVSGLDECYAVSAASRVPIALDESARMPGALEHRYADLVCLKISGCGGITGVIEAAARARATGYEVYLSSTLDGPLGIAAAVHAATVVRPGRPCGLATLDLFEARPDPWPPVNGRIPAPAGAGLGIDPADWYA